MEMNQNKRAVVFGGGGARGSYEIGVWKVLNEIGFFPEIAVGTSVGSLNACLLAQGSFEKALAAWKEIQNHGIFSVDLPENLSNPSQTKMALIDLAKGAIKGGGVGYEPLADLLDNYVHEEDLRKSSILFGLMTTKTPLLQSTPLFIDEIPTGQVKEYLLASCACYPAMKPYTVEGIQYIDGGYSDNVPIGMALSKGATEIVAVDLKSPGLLVNHSLPKGSMVIHINRLWDLGQLLLFDNARCYRNIRLGYLEAKKAFGLLDGYRYTFYKGSFENIDQEEIGTRIRTILYKFRLFGILFPEITTTSINENRVLDTAKDLLGKNLEEIKNVPSLLLAGAEALGRNCQVSPLPIYTKERFAKAISLMAKEHVSKNAEQVNIMASEKELFFGFSQGNRDKNLNMVRQIKRKLLQTKVNSREISNMYNKLLLYPMEFLEALYAMAFEIDLEKMKVEGK